MALSPGQTLGPYQVLTLIGEGGMGRVYRARDPRLDREVAIKVLSPELARDPAAMTRFEREATSIARLSHPNVLAIHEFVHGDPAYVVMEIVDGETLRARLARGPIAPRRAVAFAQQIAHGLAAAHARGIVHRDLKPENVMITRDDRVKILDFGLAKPVDAAGTGETRGASAATQAGTILGTIGYMAPEQVRGLAVDPRADLFALGAVIYEMLSGRRAFAGATAADTMSAILTVDPPDLDVAALDISPGLDRVVRRCLEKSVDVRFQSATDLGFALETLSTIGSGAGKAPSTASTPAIDAIDAIDAIKAIDAAGAKGSIGRGASAARATAWLPWTIAGVAIAGAVATWWMSRAVPVEARWSTFTRITEAAGEETSPSLSPDGSTVIYAARANGRWGIFSTRAGGRSIAPVVSDPNHDYRSPVFSPDGSLIAFHESTAKGGIFIAGATGESVRRVTDSGFDPAWSPDGRSIAFASEEVDDPAERLAESAIFVVPVEGGTPRQVVDGDGVQPAWSPRGDRLVYWSNTNSQRDLYTVAAAGGPRTPLTLDAAIDWCPIWSPDGRFVYFSSDRGGEMNLWRMAVDASNGRPIGAPEAVTNGVQAGAALPSFSKDGRRLAFRSMVSSTNPVAIPFDPVRLTAGAPTVLSAEGNRRLPIDVSADGSLLAYDSLGDRQEDLFVGPARGGALRRVTDDPARDRAPVFTRDGRSLVFYSNRDGVWAIWQIDLDGGNLRKLATSPGGANYPLVSPKGDEIIFDSGTWQGVYRMPLAGGSPPVSLPNVRSGSLTFSATAWSPDGARLAGDLADRSGLTVAIGIYDLQAHAMTAVSNDDNYAVRWLNDSRRVVYFTHGGWQLVVLDTVTRARTVVDVSLPAPSVTDFFAISPDNRTIYYGARRAEADIWMAERK